MSSTAPATAPAPASIGADSPRTEILAPGAVHASPQPASLLDHRVRRRALPVELAPPGRYLALADGEQPLLIGLEDDVTRIGRGLGADLRIDDDRISRRHAIIYRHGARVRLLDDRSSNGTFVNGRRVAEIDLHDGDLIHIGPVDIRYLELSAERVHPSRRIGRAGAAPGERRSQRAFEGWVASRMRTRARERRAGPSASHSATRR
jgi:FHA domain